jgi:hypothetical protein
MTEVLAEFEAVSKKVTKGEFKDDQLSCHVFYPPAFAKTSARQVGKAEDTTSPSLSRVSGM